jgi:hypothetical protein
MVLKICRRTGPTLQPQTRQEIPAQQPAGQLGARGVILIAGGDVEREQLTATSLLGKPRTECFRPALTDP